MDLSQRKEDVMHQLAKMSIDDIFDCFMVVGNEGREYQIDLILEAMDRMELKYLTREMVLCFKSALSVEKY